MGPASTCYMDALTTGKQVLAQLLGQGRQQSALYEARQRGVQDHAQQRLGHWHGAALERPLQVPDLECGLPRWPPPRGAAQSIRLILCYACKLRQIHDDELSEKRKLCLRADLRRLTALLHPGLCYLQERGAGVRCRACLHLLNSKSSASATSISRESSPMEALGTLLPRSPTRPTSARRSTAHRPALPDAQVLAEPMAPEPWLVPVRTLAAGLTSAQHRLISTLHVASCEGSRSADTSSQKASLVRQIPQGLPGQTCLAL